MYLLHSSILYKQGKKLQDWSYIIGEYGIVPVDNIKNKNILGFKFIDEFVEYSIISSEKIKTVLDEYIGKIGENIYREGSAFDKITNFQGLNDKEIIENLILMKNEIKLNKYDLDLYSKILSSLIEIKCAGFNKNIIDDIINQMELNLKKSDNIWKVNFIPYTYSYSADLHNIEYYKIMKKWRRCNEKRINEIHKLNIKDIIEKEEWGEKLKIYCKENSNNFKNNGQFFSNIDIPQLINKLMIADTNNVWQFIRAIGNIYDVRMFASKMEDDVSQIYKKDLKTIINLKQSLINNLNIDMENSKRYAIDRLIDVLENWEERLKI